MSQIFISHSHKDNEEALAVRQWLIENGWDDVFLDVDRKDGIAPGERWKHALQKAAFRCEMVLALVSSEWLQSPWCRAEMNTAQLMGKKIIAALLGADPNQVRTILPEEQWVDLRNDVHGYARLAEGLRRAGLDPLSFPFESDRRPYPGLSPLEEKDAAIYFGRDAEIVRALDKLRSMARNNVERMLVIVGASGSGKSSFMRAGLWPRLKRDEKLWLPLPTVRPERAVISGKFGLAQSIGQLMQALPLPLLEAKGLPRTRSSIEQLLANENGLAEILMALRTANDDGSGHSATIILPIDQGEELFNTQGSEEAAQFVDSLTRTLESVTGFLTILNIRSDAFPKLQSDRTLSRLPKEAFALDRMQEGSYRVIIEGPARLRGPTPLRLDPLLIHALLEDAARQGALPLLAFTLERLYERYAAEGELTLAQYERLGRIRGMIDRAVADSFADAVQRGELSEDPQVQFATARALFVPHLVQVNESAGFTRRVAKLEEIPASAHPLVDRFVERRLLVKDRRHAGGEEEVVVEVAHEALLSEWRDLRNALQEERSFLIWLSRAKADAEQYFSLPIKSSSSALLRGFPLDQAVEWVRKKPSQVAERVREFVKISASVADAAARHNRIVESIARFGVPFVLAALVFGTFGFFVFMMSSWIMGMINLNDNTNACFHEENIALRELLRAVANHQFNPDDIPFVGIDTGADHRCYRIKDQQ